MNRVFKGVVRRLPMLVCVGLMTLAVACLPLSRLSSFGEALAFITAGLENPRGGAVYVQKLVERRFDAEQEMPPVPSFGAKAEVPTVAPMIPPKGEGGGSVSEEQITGTPVAGRVSVKNTTGLTFDFDTLLSSGLPFEKTDSDEVRVLIVHTHACECYMPYYAGYYNADDETRNVDTTQNMVAVGEAIAQELRAAGIGVVHDETLHDHPAYSGSYGRSEQTVSAYLKQYPSIRVVLDIHRDAILHEDMTKVKPTVTVNGQKAAQMMVLVGGTSTAELPNAYCEANLRLGLQLHQAMEERYEGIMRPLYLVDARYNQGLCAGSLLVEVGTDANTLSEALYSGRLLGKTLSGLLS